MNNRELANKILWLGYANAEEGKDKRKEAINEAEKLINEHLKEQLALFNVSGICISCGTKTKGQSLCDVCNARGLDAYE